MNFEELIKFLVHFEAGEYSENELMCYAAKYFEPIIDTRTMCCFAIKVRPWFKNEFVLDYRDTSKHETFYEYVSEYFANAKVKR